MLMLACVHDPCINCAATAYAEQVHIKSQNPDVRISIYRSIYVKYVRNKLFWMQPLLMNLVLLLRVMSKCPHLQRLLFTVQSIKESEARQVLTQRKKNLRLLQKLSIIVRSTVRRKFHIIVLHAPLIFVQNVLFMVNIQL